MVDAEGPTFPDAGAAIGDAYARDISDEFVLPAVIGGYRGMRDGDGVLCFNFRADRVREILAALLDPAFSGFPRTARRAVRGRRRHDAIQHAPGSVPGHDLPAAVHGERAGRGGVQGRPHAAAHGGDGEISARHLFPQRRQRGALCGRGPHHGAVAQGGDLRPAAGDVGAGADRQGGGGDRQRQIRSHRAELRQSRHGRPYRHPGGGDQGRGDRGSVPRPAGGGDRVRPAERCW